MNAEKIESLSFEDSYALLEQVIQKLESGNLSLEESVALYEQGIKLAAHCGRKLDDAQLRVTQLLSAVSEEAEENAEGED